MTTDSHALNDGHELAGVSGYLPSLFTAAASGDREASQRSGGRDDSSRTPYYQDSWVTIYHGDCREIMWGMDKVDLVVTSPPYNTLPKSGKASGLHAERKNGVNQWMTRAAEGYADSMPEPEYQRWLNEIITMCREGCNGLVWVNHKVRYRDGVAMHPVRFLEGDIYCEVIWDRKGSMALNCKRYAPSHEGLWAFGKPHVWNDQWNMEMSVWSIPFDRDPNAHPCAYPLELALRPILSSSMAGDTVLDPFMGSGTTLRAAKDTGRRAIGIEREECYCEIAAKRMSQEVLNFTPIEPHAADLGGVRSGRSRNTTAPGHNGGDQRPMAAK